MLWCPDNSEGELRVRTWPSVSVFQCVPVLQCSWVSVQRCCVSCSEGGLVRVCTQCVYAVHTHTHTHTKYNCGIIGKVDLYSKGKNVER